MGPALVDLKNVRVIRGDNVALDDFSLRVEAGEHVAILGPNGCGKSTLIKTITRECYPVVREESSMTILGRDRWNIFELRSVLGIVSNDLMSDCTSETSGREVVLSGFFSSTRIFDHQTVEPEHRMRADAVLERLGVPHLSDVIPEIDRVVLMRSGRIQADGRKEDLLEPEQISQLFGIRVDITRSDGYYHLW